MLSGGAGVEPKHFPGLHEFRRAIALRGGREVHRAKIVEEMVEDRDKGLDVGRNAVPELPRDGEAKGHQDTAGARFRHGQHSVHRPSGTAHSGKIRCE